VEDDLTTKDVNETRYSIENVVGEPHVMPFFAFTVYLFPIDVQGRVGWRERLPNPTLGFGFTKPASDIFVGFSHEVVRNLQFVWGYHFGTVTEVLPRNGVTEDQDATAPLTRERRDKAFMYGLTFNLNLVAKNLQVGPVA
jgi:hypothetical protein